jgi:hypothetical protein
LRRERAGDQACRGAGGERQQGGDPVRRKHLGFLVSVLAA